MLNDEALDQIYECIYDHGAGKTKGAISKQQREKAYQNINQLKNDLKALELSSRPLSEGEYLTAIGSELLNEIRCSAGTLRRIVRAIERAKQPNKLENK